MNRAEQDMRDHREVWDLIPWVVNGTASDEQRQRVEAHARLCDDCGRELKFQQSLQSAFADAPAPQLDAEASLRKIQAQLDDGAPVEVRHDAGTPMGVRRRRGRAGLWRFRARALLAAVIIEALALAALGNAWWLQMRSRPTGGEYQVLSVGAAAPAAATIRVVLSPGTTAAELQALLLNANLQIVAGPSEAGVYSLGPRAVDDPAARRTALALLRSNPQVRFAEPVSNSPELR